MCGIAGEIALTKFSSTDLERAWPMIHTILHRGPDDCRGWESKTKRAALLHSRLSIVDLEHGQQPMHGTEGEVTIVFNGEIYGFKRLRKELEQSGYRFATTSDTEILIALYLRDGPGFVDQLEGEFAFVLYDGGKQRTLVARDRFGVKPLFYSVRDGIFLFGSEIKAILAHPHVERRIDPEVMHRRIHSVLLPDETMFKGIKAVLPGSVMMLDGNGQITNRRHAELDPEKAGQLRMDQASAEDAFEEAFSAAVSERLHGDVEVGIFLSGGVDSSLVAAMTRDVSTANHPTYTIGFKNRHYGEAERAGQTASHLGFDHDVEPVGSEDLDAHFARSLWHAESNVVNTHGTAKLCLSDRASKRVKVILAGEGADEIHGGYAYYRHAALLEAVQDKKNVQALKDFIKDNGPEDGVLSKATPQRRNTLAGASSAGIPYAAQRADILQDMLRNVLNPEFRASVMLNPAGQLIDWLDHYNPQARRLDDMTLSRFTSAITDMPNYNLSFMGDRSEMANSIEGRLPFLDKRVVDLLWGLPNKYHAGDQTKTLIRSALAKRLPTGVASRYKRMFVSPPATNNGLFEGEQADHWFSKQTTRSVGVFRPTAVSSMRKIYKLLPQSSRFRRVIESFLMTVLSAHVIDDMFIRNFDRSLETYRPDIESVRQTHLHHELVEPAAE